MFPSQAPAQAKAEVVPCSSQEPVGLNKSVTFILSLRKFRFADLHASCQFRCSKHQSDLLRGMPVLRGAVSYNRLKVGDEMGAQSQTPDVLQL